jgi:riboflavin kinase/FMN adenylyltransferase
VTIGNFDGVHVGHAALVRRAREFATDAGRVVVLAFDPHPLSALRPDAAPGRLSTYTQREKWLRELGADEVLRLTPDADTLGLSAEQFVEKLVREFHPSAVIEGGDFRFGRGRGGDVGLLRSLGDRHGFRACIVDAVSVELPDQTIVPASSSLARWFVSHGRVRDAAAILGRPYELPGLVIRGERRGRVIGFPTANLRSDCLLPADGVYAGEAELDDGRRFAAAISVGTKPTFDATDRAVEAFLLGVNARPGATIPGLPEYGWTLRLRLLDWIRDQVRFASAADLVDQMTRDCERIADTEASLRRQAATP